MSALGDSLRYLRGRGFEPLAARRPARAFAGLLQCAKGPVPVRLTISDWDFLEYPQISLDQPPAFLPPLLPHVDAHGDLCYFAPGSVTLDRYDPVAALAQCLDQATTVLSKIATDASYRHDDIQTEFAAHWELGQRNEPWKVFLGTIDAKASDAHYFKLRDPTQMQTRVLVCSHPPEAQRLAAAWGWTLIPSADRCWLLKTDKPPLVPQQMPTTVKALFQWLRSWDRQLATTLQNVLGEPQYLKQKFITFAIDTPVGWIGLGFDLDQMKRLGYQRAPKLFRNFLHNAGGGKALFRMRLRQIGGDFVHNRNLTYRDLSGKRVTVVGCGAIGSFAASALVRLGAGSGKKGCLRLIDPDELNPENLGRHTLGYPALLQHKATALRDELRRQFPHSEIVSDARSAFDANQLFAADLIVDATGEESVSELINGLRLERALSLPVLHVWIRGNGEAVQALWAEGNEHACYRCLVVPDLKIHRRERIPLLKTIPERRMDGCRSYTPYAVSAPMHAAALAADMICDWLQGDPAPRFRTRARENADVFGAKNQDLTPIKGCPACGQL
ncbi:ThiF family adenylyltransferase [Roseateles chitinivorans]|uniref:ThiF family adenylyltransferase n=1 Tax=Roseateles chitinivorans TaxID=2917965 RepID=UPI003D67CD1E